MKNLIILGAAGSIGTQTLELFNEYQLEYNIVALTLSRNLDKNINILKKIKNIPKYLFLQDKSNYKIYKKLYPNSIIKYGKKSILNFIKTNKIDTVLNAISGIYGLEFSYISLKYKKNLLLANKETLIAGSTVITNLAKKNNIQILPIDSEHNALFNLLKNRKNEDIEKLIITASGGSFRDYSRKQLENVKIEDALNHPTWKMGAKITIDSATMVNKAFEIIEARHLFDYKLKDIIPYIHKESLVHAALKLKSKKYDFFISKNDMKNPILNILLYPNNFDYHQKAKKKLVLNKIDFERFIILDFLYKNYNDKYFGAIFSAIDEVLVDLFLKNLIKFKQIDELIIKYYEQFKNYNKKFNLKNILKLFNMIDYKIRKDLTNLKN